jgi:inosose dehydratase
LPDNDGWVERYLDEAAEAGFEGVELSPGMLGDFGNDFTALSDALSRRGLTLSGVVIAGHLEDPAAWPALVRQARQAAEALAMFDARHLIVIDMLVLDGAPPPLPDREWAHLIATIHRLADLAASLGLVLAVHPHVDSHLESESEIIRFLRETDPARVPLCLDTGQFAYVGIDPIRFFRDHHERISCLHLKNIDRAIRDRHQHHRLPWVHAVRDGVSSDLTTGVVDLRALRDALDDTNYDGWVIAELDRAPTVDDEPFRMAMRARGFLHEIGIG